MAEDIDAAGIVVEVGELPAGRTRFFDCEVGGETTSAFVVHGRDGVWRCFVNLCPHVPVYGLDFGDGEVIDGRDGLIVCANHGARFVPESGECVFGPCRGDRLVGWRCEPAGAGAVRIYPEPVPAGWPHS